MYLASHVVCYRVIAESANWVKCFAESYREHYIESDKRCDRFTNTEPRLNITCKLKIIYATKSWISQWHNYSVLVRISFHFSAVNVSGHKCISTLRRHSSYTVLIYIQQDATLPSLFYMETAVHISGGNTTHHQERKTTVSTASGICHTVTAICRYRRRVGTWFECAVSGVRHPQHT